MSPDDNFRDSTDVAQTTFCGIQEVIHLLRGDGHRKAVVRRRKCDHKDLTLHFLAGINVHIGHRVPGEVHEQVLVTIPIRRQHEGWLLCLCILIDMIIELSVTVPVRIPCPVLASERYIVMCFRSSSDAIYGRRSLRSWNLPPLYAGLPPVSTRSISGSSMAEVPVWVSRRTLPK